MLASQHQYHVGGRSWHKVSNFPEQFSRIVVLEGERFDLDLDLDLGLLGLVMDLLDLDRDFDLDSDWGFDRDTDRDFDGEFDLEIDLDSDLSLGLFCFVGTSFFFLSCYRYRGRVIAFCLPHNFHSSWGQVVS